MEKTCNLFENEGFQELSKGIMRPGGFKITEDGVRLAKLNLGMKVLDVGCGIGSTLQYLNKDFGIDGIGVDFSDSILENGRKVNPELDLRKGEGGQLDFPSTTFDAVLMECTLSLFPNQSNALLEAYRVLKVGGKLVISDFYLRDTKSQDCTSSEGFVPIGSCINGAFEKEELIKVIEDIGYYIIEWEDRTKELKEFTAEIIMNCGSMENFWKSILPDGIDSSKYTYDMSKAKLGYFLLAAKKK